MESTYSMSKPMFARDQLPLLLKTRCLALTGGIATGKSTIAAILRTLGVLVIDADQLSRDLVQPGEDAWRDIVQHFGPSILTKEGAIDRKQLRQLIFADAKQREHLESLIHPRLNEALYQTLLKNSLGQSTYFFYEASLIFERQRQGDFLEVWTSYCPPAVQRQRLQARDQLNPQEIEAILAAQMPALEKSKLAQHVFNTDCSLEDLKVEVHRYWQTWLQQHKLAEPFITPPKREG